MSLTTAQVEALQAWVDAAKPLLELTHWKITAVAHLDPDQPMSAVAFAACFIRDYSDTAEITLGNGFWAESPEGRRQTLVHELIHCHLYRAHSFTWDQLNRLGAEAKAIVREELTTLEELAVEHFANIIAPLLPLPEIPDADGG